MSMMRERKRNFISTLKAANRNSYYKQKLTILLLCQKYIYIQFLITKILIAFTIEESGLSVISVNEGQV